MRNWKEQYKKSVKVGNEAEENTVVYAINPRIANIIDGFEDFLEGKGYQLMLFRILKERMVIRLLFMEVIMIHFIESSKIVCMQIKELIF